jgi:hypothetical protein
MFRIESDCYATILKWISDLRLTVYNNIAYCVLDETFTM